MHRRCWGLLLSALLASGLAPAAPGAHQHGLARLSVAIDGTQLSLTLEAPLDVLLGFERAPRSDAERKAAAGVLQQLRLTGTLFKPDAAAGCTPGAVSITAPVLEPGAAAQPGDHADLDATYAWRCAQPQALQQMEIRLFDAFARLQRIEAQVAGPKGQLRSLLQRPARHLPLRR